MVLFSLVSYKRRSSAQMDREYLEECGSFIPWRRAVIKPSASHYASRKLSFFVDE